MQLASLEARLFPGGSDVVFALLLFQAPASGCPPSPCQDAEGQQHKEPSSLLVQVLGPADAAIGGAEVVMKPSRSQRPVRKEFAGADGYARIGVRAENDDATYTAEVRELEFKTKSLAADPHPQVAIEAPTAKLQVHLELKPSTSVVY